MGCGSSTASAPGRFNDDTELYADGQGRMVLDKKTGKTRQAPEGKDEDGRGDDFFAVEEATGEQFMAVRPWIGQITEPANHNPVNNAKPDITYALEYVYGYRCADSKQNVFWNKNGQAVYMTAALGVILDTGSNTQKFFGGGEVDNTAKNVANDQNAHTDDVLAIAIDSSRSTCASGQSGAAPTIFTWDAVTGQKKNRIKVAKGARGIAAISINDAGMIAAVDLHNEHQVYCFDQAGNAIFKEKGDTNKIHDVCWDAKPNSQRFASAGVKHIYFWDASQAGGAKAKGIFGNFEQTSFACVAFDDQGQCFTGGANSQIYVWGGDDGRTCTGTMKHHSAGFISAMRFTNGKLYSGGKDGKVLQIDTTSKQVTKQWAFPGLVRAIDFDMNKLIVGQRDGTISVIDAGGAKNDVMKSHSDGEVWGLAINPQGHVLTSGDDNKAMIWDPKARKNVATLEISKRDVKIKRGASTLSTLPDSQCSRAVAVNQNWICLGSNDGAVSVRKANAPTVETMLLKDSKEWIEVMAFSPDSKYLAVGSHDNNIYIYKVEDFSLVGSCKSHRSYIMAMDWSADSTMIRSNCGAYELLFHTIPNCAQDPNGRSTTVSTTWASQTVKFQWSTEGIYPSGTDGTHINSVSGSPDGQHLATGDDYGLVNLFRDPCRNGGIPRSYRGHSEHVVRVAFSPSGDYIYSVGGYDQTLMQWKKV